VLLEPMVEIFKSKAEQLNDRLCEIRDNLTSVVSNTEAQLARNTWVFKPIEFAEKAEAQLRNNEAYGWLIRDIAVTVECEVFLNAPNGAGFLAKLKAGENVHWYVPVGSILIVKGVGAAAGFANVNIESLVTSASQGRTGRSEEHISIPRLEPTPSGNPLDEAVAPPRL
jgi:hypothetical protein